MLYWNETCGKHSIVNIRHSHQCTCTMNYFKTYSNIVQVYLTSLFLTPLIGLYSFDHGSPRLRNIAKRTFVGSTGTLLSSVAYVTYLSQVVLITNITAAI